MFKHKLPYFKLIVNACLETCHGIKYYVIRKVLWFFKEKTGFVNLVRYYE